MSNIRENGGENFRNEGAWTAFHQAYDSAMRAWRRGPDVSRAVNWLFVASRDNTSEDERDIERQNREIGLKLGSAAKSEVEIAPLVWQAAQDGALITTPRLREAVLASTGAEAPPAPPAAPSTPTADGENPSSSGDSVTVPGVSVSPEFPGSGEVRYPEGKEPPPEPVEPETPGKGLHRPGFDWEYLL